MHLGSIEVSSLIA